MNPTDPSEELRKEISNLMVDLMLQTKLIKLGDDKSMLRQGRKFIHTHNTRLNEIMALIASYSREARIEELEYGIAGADDDSCVEVISIKKRIKALKEATDPVIEAQSRANHTPKSKLAQGVEGSNK